jgi:hypothetical protein
LFRESKIPSENAALKRILRQLLYYDVFDHPLSRKELKRFCSLTADDENMIDELVREGIVYKLNGFYSVRDLVSLTGKRKRGNEIARQEMPRALKMALRISAFPFVRSVSMSGSISKGYMDELKDVDFFIITTPNRLWLARTILVLYKKLFLKNSFKYFCLNYFLDEKHLEIEDKNIFTATELLTLIPVSGKTCIEELYKKNLWVKEYYDMYPYRETSEVPENSRHGMKRFAEAMLCGKVGNLIDIWCMRLTISFWKRKYRNFHNRIGNSSFRFDRHTSKYHPGNFQARVLDEYRMRVNRFEREQEIKIGI